MNPSVIEINWTKISTTAEILNLLNREWAGYNFHSYLMIRNSLNKCNSTTIP